MAVVDAAHRLTLSGPEWMLLCRLAGVAAPPGFAADADTAEHDIEAAADTLTDNGVLSDGGQLHPSVAANLAVFTRPAALVRTEASVGEGGLRSAHVVRGPLGCSLFTLDGGGVELSMFPAIALGRELIRCIPDPAAPESPAVVDAAIRAALGVDPDDAEPLRGRLPLAALADFGFLPPPGTGRLNLTGAEAALAARLTGQTSGVLHCLVVGRSGAGGGPADAVLVGEVLWLLTNAGWVGLAPRPDGSGRQMVEVVPVRREEIGTWLAPYLARMLEGVTD